MNKPYDIITLEKVSFVCGCSRTEAALTRCEWAEHEFNAWGIVRGVEFNQSFHYRKEADGFMLEKIIAVKEEILEILATVAH